MQRVEDRYCAYRDMKERGNKRSIERGKIPHQIEEEARWNKSSHLLAVSPRIFGSFFRTICHNRPDILGYVFGRDILTGNYGIYVSVGCMELIRTQALRTCLL